MPAEPGSYSPGGDTQDWGPDPRVLLLRSELPECLTLGATIRQHPGFRIAAEVAETGDAVRKARKEQPDVVLVIGDAQPSPTAATARIRRASPRNRIIVVGDEAGRAPFLLRWHPIANYLTWNQALRSSTERFVQTIQECRSEPALMYTERLALRGLLLKLTEGEVVGATGLQVRRVREITTDLKQRLRAPTHLVLGVRATEHGWTRRVGAGKESLPREGGRRFEPGFLQ